MGIITSVRSSGEKVTFLNSSIWKRGRNRIEITIERFINWESGIWGNHPVFGFAVDLLCQTNRKFTALKKTTYSGFVFSSPVWLTWLLIAVRKERRPLGSQYWVLSRSNCRFISSFLCIGVEKSGFPKFILFHSVLMFYMNNMRPNFECVLCVDTWVLFCKIIYFISACWFRGLRFFVIILFFFVKIISSKTKNCTDHKQELQTKSNENLIDQ